MRGLRKDEATPKDAGGRPGRQATGETKVPLPLRRLWGLPSASRLGRPAELDVARVVRAAVELADRDGIAGVTLPRVARALGYTPMSLYRHVGSKDELLRLIADHAVGAPPSIRLAPARWRDALRLWARAHRELYERRSWLARLPASGPPNGPNHIAWMEVALFALRGTRLGWAEKVGVLTLLSGFVRQATLFAQDLSLSLGGSPAAKAEAERRQARSLALLVTKERFPEMSRLLASGLFDAPPAPARAAVAPTADPDFVFGLERILDGVAAALARAPRRPGASRMLPGR